MTPPRSGSLGCLGVFSILCLAFFSVVEVGLAWWLNASWFDRVAFWRAPRVVPAPPPADPAHAAAAMAQWANEAAGPVRAPAPDPSKPVLLEEARVTADYTPSAGATVTDPGNRATVKFPAGALRQAARVSLTPVHSVPAAQVGSFAGPVYEVRVDDRDHTAFQRPIELSFPYVPGLVPQDQVAVHVWENGRWVALPSTVDRARGVVIATSPHASLFSVAGLIKFATATSPLTWKLLPVLPLVTALAENDITRAAAFSALYGRSEEYETPEGNFKIHYYVHGAAKIPRDSDVLNDPFTPKDRGDRPPVYVGKIAHWLEYARAELRSEGFVLPAPKLIRYDCFLVPVGESGKDLGESNVGGPLFISSKLLDVAKEDQADMEQIMKATCVHELLHVAQGRHYGTVKTEIGWISVERFAEADAEYNSWRFWRTRGMDDEYHSKKYIEASLALPATPLDRTNETERYAYSLWFEWMQHRFGEPVAREFLAEAHAGRDGSLASLDAAARKVLGPRGIPDLGFAMAEFGLDYYHRDWWTATLCPRLVKGKAAGTEVVKKFFDDGFGAGKERKSAIATVVRKTSNGSVVRNLFEEGSRRDLPHLTSRAVYFVAEPLAGETGAPQPRLVIEAEGAAASASELQIVVAQGTKTNPYDASASGSPGAAELMTLRGGKGQTVVERFGGKDGPNVVTVVVTNRSLETDLGGLTIRRWLLEPPEYATLDAWPQGPDRRLLTWKPSELERHREVFGKYRVYRRRPKAPKDQKEHVKDVAAGSADPVRTEILGKDAQDHVYSVAVVDVRGNESEPRDAEPDDPFVGTWEGQFALVEGSFAQPLMDAMQKSAAETEAKRRAEIGRIQDPERRRRELRELDEAKRIHADISKMIEKLAKGAEEAARMGVPLQFKIRLADGKYWWSLSELLWGMVPLEPDMKSETEFKRVGPYTLRLPDTPEGMRPFELTLHRLDPRARKPNVIRENGYVLQTTGDAAKELPIRCVLRWDFERVETKAPR